MLKLNKRHIILFLIIILGIFIRFYRILDFPVQLNHDEVSQLYDAISIAQTHKDVYGNFLPSIFISVNDYKSPFYTYITSFFYLIFGGGELTIKLPAAIFGSLIILAVYFLTLKLLENENVALMSSFLTATAPFEIFFSRKSFENVVGIFFMLVGFALLLLYVRKKSTKFILLSNFSLGIAIYTYYSHVIIIPLLLMIFIWIYREFFLKNLRQILYFGLLLILLCPLFIIIMTNPTARYRSSDVFIIQDINLGRNIDFAKSTNHFINFFARNKAILDFSFNRYLEQFNFAFIFANGLDFTNQGLLGMGPLPLMQFPFLVLGIVYLVKSRNHMKEKKFILAWIILGMLPSGLTFEQHSSHRSIMVFTMLNIISAAGLFFFFDYLRSVKIRIFSYRLILTILIFVFSINYLYFIHMYFVNFPFEKSQDLHYPFKQVAQFAWKHHDEFDQIIFDPLFGEIAPVVGTAAHYYLAYYGGYPPAKFQKEYTKGPKEREILFDNFSIRKIDWREDRNLKNILLIGSPWSLPIDTIDKSKIINTLYFYNRKEAFYAIKL